MADCSNCRSPNESTGWLSCEGATPIEPDNDIVAVYAHRVTGGSDPAWVYCITVGMIRAHRFVYIKKNPGDCGTASDVSLGNPATMGSQIAGLGAGLSGGLAASFSSLTALSALAGPLAIAVAPLAILGAIFAHHAMAVAREQDTLCKVFLGYMGFANAMEDAIRKGTIGLQDANLQLDSAAQQLDGAMAGIDDGHNAAFGYRKGLRGLVLFTKEKIYPALTPAVSKKAIFGAAAVGGGILVAKLLA